VILTSDYENDAILTSHRTREKTLRSSLLQQIGSNVWKKQELWHHFLVCTLAAAVFDRGSCTSILKTIAALHEFFGLRAVRQSRRNEMANQMKCLECH